MMAGCEEAWKEGARMPLRSRRERKWSLLFSVSAFSLAFSFSFAVFFVFSGSGSGDLAVVVSKRAL